MVRARITKVLLLLVGLVAARSVYVASYWSWNDREALFEEHMDRLGWPAAELVLVEGGYATSGPLELRTHGRYVERGGGGAAYELRLRQAWPFGRWTVEAASASG